MMASFLISGKFTIYFTLILCVTVETDSFSWSGAQQGRNLVSSRLGSTAVLSCDYTLTPSEEQRASSFYLLTWSREVPRGSGQWASLVLDSPPMFLGKQDLNLNDRFHFGIKSSLRVYGVTHEDDTNYRCEYRSSFPTTPKNVRLQVQYVPKDTQLKATHTSLKAGDNLFLNCSSLANPRSFYQIYKDGNLVQNTTSGDYFVQKVDRSQQGEYKCIPVNELGLGAEKTIKITVEAASVTPARSKKNLLDDFPLWAFGAIGGGCLITILIIVIACKCRGGKNEGTYKPKLNEQSQGAFSRNSLRDVQTKNGPDMYRDQEQDTTAHHQAVTERIPRQLEPTHSGLPVLKETSLAKPSTDHEESHEGPYLSLRTLENVDKQYESLKTFDMRRRSFPIDETDHPESHLGPCSSMDSILCENTLNESVSTRSEEDIEEAIEMEQDESRGSSPPPLYGLELSKEEYV